jgi:hypothetical protein
MFVHCCHCLNCQRQTGSAFVLNLLIERDRFELRSGDLHAVEAPRDEDPPQRIHRCTACGVAIHSLYGSPKVLFVRAGTLDDPAGIEPDVHIYTRSKVAWLTLPDDTPAFDAYYDPRELWPAESIARYRALS